MSRESSLTSLTHYLSSFQHKSFANAEDRGRRNVRTNENVERVRRCHQNDLENIPIFFAVGFLFLQLNPPASAVYYFYAFTAARYVVYSNYFQEQS